LVEAPTGVGKTRIALEFVREFWRRRGRCRVLVLVPRRVLAYNPWKKEIDRWMSDLEPKCLILSGFMPPRERMLNLVPTLAVAKAWVENNSMMVSIERRMLS
jgi:ERCC4-related helicase